MKGGGALAASSLRALAHTFLGRIQVHVETLQPPFLLPERLPDSHVACSLPPLGLVLQEAFAGPSRPPSRARALRALVTTALVCACAFICLRFPVHLSPGHELSGLRLGRAPHGTAGHHPLCGRCWSWALSPGSLQSPAAWLRGSGAGGTRTQTANYCLVFFVCFFFLGKEKKVQTRQRQRGESGGEDTHSPPHHVRPRLGGAEAGPFLHGQL